MDRLEKRSSSPELVVLVIGFFGVFYMSSTTKDAAFVLPRSRTLSVCMTIFETLDTPVSLSCFLMCKYKEWDQLVSKSVEPKNYNQHNHFYRDYQAVSLLRKADFLDTSFDKSKISEDKFWSSEELCRDSNDRIDSWEQDGYRCPGDGVSLTLLRAANFILRILGPSPNRNAVLSNCRFGPGVTSHTKTRVCLPAKYAPRIGCTPALLPFLPDILGRAWMSTLETVDVLDGNTLAHVPKDAKTDRAICIEPHLNIYLQLGIGAEIRRRLSPWIHLDRQQEVNRFLVSKCHVWGLSTIDLSSASDTICTSLCRVLLPPEWFDLIDLARSRRVILPNGSSRPYEKISSMGNGFTFELETLIFYALARACGSKACFTAVYGDDIILEKQFDSHLRKCLAFCGFKVNEDKSFCSSSFFESCGADYFDGFWVRPFYLKSIEETTHFLLINSLRRLGLSLAGDRDFFQNSVEMIRRHIPKKHNGLLVPCTFGDVGIHSEFDEAVPVVERLPHGLCGFRIKALKFVSRQFDYSRSMSGYLYSLDKNPIVSQSAVPHRGVGSWAIRRVTVFGQWPSLVS